MWKVKAMSNMIDARALALKVSTATLSDLAALGDYKAEVIRGPLMTMLDLQRDFGDDMTNVPEIDTENEEGKPAAYANPEWYQEKRYNASTGATTKARMSFFWKLADSTTTGVPIVLFHRPDVVGGVEINAMLDTITAKLGDDLTPDKPALKKERGYWQGRKAENRKNIRKAFQIDQQTRAIKSQLDKLSVEILMDDVRDTEGKLTGESEVTKSKMAIKIWEKANVHRYVVVSVGTFCQFDVAKAKLNGGTLEDLTSTTGRGTNDNATNNQQTPLAFNDLEAIAVRTTALLEQDGIGNVIKRRSKEKDTGSIFAWNMVNLMLAMQAACSELVPLWEQVEKENDAAAAAARAKLEGKAA